MVRLVTVALLALLVALCSSHKILVYIPLFGHSHVKYLSRLGETLAENGHEVHVVMPLLDLTVDIKKHSFKHIKNIRRVPLSQKLQDTTFEVSNEMVKNFWTMSADPSSLVKSSVRLSDILLGACEEIMKNDDLIESLRKENYTIGLSEPFYFCGFGLMEVLNIPVTLGAKSNVQMDHVSNFIGEPIMPSYVPGTISEYNENMSFFERISNAFGTAMGIKFFSRTFEREHEMLVQKYGSFRSVSDVLSDVNYMFTNSNPYLNFGRPTISKTIEIGGITVDYGKTSKKVDEKWDKILSERKHNVFISFGSVAHSRLMPDSYKKALLETFAEMKDVTFIWKYEEKTTMADHLPNVHLSPWLPQVALLNDPRLSIFVTHGGLGSTMEVSFLGKPAIYIPLFADQPRNAKMAERYGGASILVKADLENKETIKNTIRKMLDDPSYAQNAAKLAATLQNTPYDSKEIFLRHVDFAGRVGRISNLNDYSKNLSFFQFYLLDVYAFMCTMAITAAVVVFLASRKILNFIAVQKVKNE